MTKHPKVVMIACISPGSTSSDHTLNTLRYTSRLKSEAQAKAGKIVAEMIKR